jgi:hypothetical protein
MTPGQSTSAEAGTPLFQRSDRAPLAALFAFALGVQVLAAVLGARGELSALGVHFDGHKYIEIARSFPLPYAPEGQALMGHAPGYPAALALARVASGGLLHWGWLALGVAWLSGALAALAFYVLCRQCGLAPLWPSLFFVAANPRWIGLASTAHAEPLATFFALACFVAWRRGAVAASAVWLALASLTRFPAVVLVASLAAGLWLDERRLAKRTALWLALPLAALAGFDAYLHWRAPGFPGILRAHAFWWQPQWSVPFLGIVRHIGEYPSALPLRELTLVSACVYVLAIAVGLRIRELAFLAIGAAAVVALAASPADPVGARAFTRLAILAWPAALLILWRRFAGAAPRTAIAAALLGLTLIGVWFAARQTGLAVQAQARGQPYLLDAIERLDSDEPAWIDYGAAHRRRR